METYELYELGYPNFSQYLGRFQPLYLWVAFCHFLPLFSSTTPIIPKLSLYVVSQSSHSLSSVIFLFFLCPLTWSLQVTSLLPQRLFLLIDPIYYWLSLLHIFISLIIFFSSRISHFACLSDFIKLFFCVFFVPHWVFLKELFWIFFLKLSILGDWFPENYYVPLVMSYLIDFFMFPEVLNCCPCFWRRSHLFQSLLTVFWMEIASINPIRDSEAMSDILLIHLFHTSDFFLDGSSKISWHLLNPAKPGQIADRILLVFPAVLLNAQFVCFSPVLQNLVSFLHVLISILQNSLLLLPAICTGSWPQVGRRHMGKVHREYYTVNHGISIFPTDPLINATKSATYYQGTAFIQISKCMRSMH